MGRREPMNRNFRWLLLCYILLLPNTMVALVYAFCVGARSWEWREGVLTFISDRLLGNPGGQGWSWIVGYASEEQRARADLRVHENTHVWQEFMCSLMGLILGVGLGLLLGWPTLHLTLAALSGGGIFAVTYGLVFLYFYLTEQKDEQPGWHDDYMRNFFERHAYAVQARFLKAPKGSEWGVK